MSSSAAVRGWLLAATWVVWPWVARGLFHRWFHGSLVMRSAAGGQDVEYLVYSPLEHVAFWLLVGVVPVGATVVWWRGRSRRRREAAGRAS